AFMPLLGFSVNLLTLFGLILAIGIVVDDAIVIVENASHHIERGLAPREATIQAMREVTGPVISITCVLMAVFLPTAFLGGITGQLYRQFALTIAATALIITVQLPDGASLDRTREVIARMNGVFQKLKDKKAIDGWFVLGGFSMLDGTTAPNSATAFAALSDFSLRKSPEMQQESIKLELQ